MKDPRDILGANPFGAVQDRPDPRNFIFGSPELGGIGAPFDWNAGYDIEAKLGKTFTAKNQGQSGSCGGQRGAYHEQAIRGLLEGDFSERSAKFIYSQTYYPGGGTTLQDVGALLVGQGVARETLTPSYENGLAPSEAFMERPQDITVAARIDATHASALAYAYLPNYAIDTVAAAISAGMGVGLGLYGTNNGTWLSSEPQPPTQAELADTWRSCWSHFLYAGKVRLHNGVKQIGVLNSWGPNVGENGWQWLDEGYFVSGAIWGAQTMTYNPNPLVLPQHDFQYTLNLGETDQAVHDLQQTLQYLGFFPAGIPPTTYYGPITTTAVLKFQVKYQVASAAELAELAGGTVGPATRAALNKI